MRLSRVLARAALVLVTAAAAAPPLHGQALDLRDLLTSSLRAGITLAPPTTPGFSHEAHFITEDNKQFLALDQFNELIANQLSAFPLASSAGGFTYKLDPALGVFTRTTDSFGPIYAERGETLGKGKFNFGLNYSRATFDTVDGVDLRGGGLRLVFTHQDTNNDGGSLQPFFEGDVITGQIYLKIQTNVTAFVLTYGVTDKLDLGFAVPLVKVELDSVTEAQVQRLATGTSSVPTLHRFQNGTANETLTQSGQASGVGDIVLRGKYSLLRNDGFSLAAAADVRVPTGEDRDLLGTGTYQVKAGVVASARVGALGPHVNLSYATATKPAGGRERAPDEIGYAIGFDVAASPRLTLAVDLLGRDLRNANRVRVQENEYVANANGSFDPRVPPVLVTARFSSLTVERASNVNSLTGSVGVKFNPVGNLLLTLNGLFAVNKQSLVDTFTPLIGVDYSF